MVNGIPLCAVKARKPQIKCFIHGKFGSENCFVQLEYSTNLKYPQLGRCLSTSDSLKLIKLHACRRRSQNQKSERVRGVAPEEFYMSTPFRLSENAGNAIFANSE